MKKKKIYLKNILIFYLIKKWFDKYLFFLITLISIIIEYIMQGLALIFITKAKEHQILYLYFINILIS